MIMIRIERGAEACGVARVFTLPPPPPTHKAKRRRRPGARDGASNQSAGIDAVNQRPPFYPAAP